MLAGEAGAGCGLSRGFRLLNLCGPYEASLAGRAGEDEAVAGFEDVGRAGRTRAEEGDDSADDGWLNFWARLLTVGRLTGSCGVARVAEVAVAGPEAERKAGLGLGRTAPFGAC
jgi:hypothetical protein